MTGRPKGQGLLCKQPELALSFIQFINLFVNAGPNLAAHCRILRSLRRHPSCLVHVLKLEFDTVLRLIELSLHNSINIEAYTSSVQMQEASRSLCWEVQLSAKLCKPTIRAYERQLSDSTALEQV